MHGVSAISAEGIVMHFSLVINGLVFVASFDGVSHGLSARLVASIAMHISLTVTQRQACR